MRSHWQSLRVPCHKHISPETSSLPLEAGFNFQVIPEACDTTKKSTAPTMLHKAIPLQHRGFLQKQVLSCARIHAQPLWGLQVNCTVSTVLQGGSEITGANTKLLPYSPDLLQVDRCSLQESHYHFKHVSERAELFFFYIFVFNFISHGEINGTHCHVKQYLQHYSHIELVREIRFSRKGICS